MMLICFLPCTNVRSIIEYDSVPIFSMRPLGSVVRYPSSFWGVNFSSCSVVTPLAAPKQRLLPCKQTLEKETD
ncbi:MAG: hypothetical protein ACKO96_01980 [Flammeovirgaceae bacterium]